MTGGEIDGAMAIRAITIVLTAALVCATRSLVERGHAPAYFAAQVVAPLSAIVLVHAALALSPWTGPGSNLRESAPQLVNDAVEVGCLLLIGWGFVARSSIARAFAPALGFLIVCAYLMTARWWHLDVGAFPHLTTQEFVGAQVFGTAGVLFVVYVIGRGRRES
ncbi:MAG: hypothetical protein H6719_20005 [Sandaracinaceae bacterium]|nr:hypothetical protein [Sandaracinaceae bacterium]